MFTFTFKIHHPPLLLQQEGRLALTSQSQRSSDTCSTQRPQLHLSEAKRGAYNYKWSENNVHSISFAFMKRNIWCNTCTLTQIQQVALCIYMTVHVYMYAQEPPPSPPPATGGETCIDIAVSEIERHLQHSAAATSPE